MKSLLGILAAAALWGGAVEVSSHTWEAGAEKEELFYYPSGKFLKEASLGYEQAVAAVAWLRAVQYYGEHVKNDREFDMMYHVCNVITDLDPHFEEPYLFGSLVLLTEGQRPEEGMKLLAKAERHNPDSWRVLFETGFVHYIVWQDYDLAARYLVQAAQMPGAPEQAERFAAYVAYKAGDLEASILLWHQLAEGSNNPEIRKKAVRKVRELVALRESGETP